MDGIDMAIETMRIKLADIKSKISQCRKKGFDTKIAELRIAGIPARIKLLEATREIKEVSVISLMLQDAAAETDEAEKNGEEQKKNVEYDLLVEQIIEAADSGLEELKYHNINKAKECYTNALGKYNSLPDERKKEVREQLEKLRNKLS